MTSSITALNPKYCKICSDSAFDTDYFCKSCDRYICDWCIKQYSGICNYCQEVIYCCNPCKNKVNSSDCWIRECKKKICQKCNNSAVPCKKSACKDHYRKMCYRCKKAECCSKNLYFKICADRKCTNLLCYECFSQDNKCESDQAHEDRYDKEWNFD